MHSTSRSAILCNTALLQSICICTFVLIMSEMDIKRYAFNASTRSIEAKTLDYLWEKAEQTTVVHRAEFYQLIWIEQGVLHLSIDFEDLHIGASQALLISPGQVC